MSVICYSSGANGVSPIFRIGSISMVPSSLYEALIVPMSVSNPYLMLRVYSPGSDPKMLPLPPDRVMICPPILVVTGGRFIPLVVASKETVPARDAALVYRLIAGISCLVAACIGVSAGAPG